MEVFFNDLSVKYRESIEFDEMRELSGLYRAIRVFNVNHCRIDDNSYHHLYMMIDRIPNNSDFKNFFFSFFQMPYESDEVIEQEEYYYTHQWKYDGEECYGLALSYIMDSISVSLQDKSRRWAYPWISIKKDEELVRARNVGKAEHVEIHRDWLEQLEEVELIDCLLAPAEKSIALTDDHGKDELLKFCKKLVRSPYVMAIINSMPYNSFERKFIKSVRENGLIEIVLTWTDKGLGIVVKTTGRNRRETEKIAEILEQKYGHI